MSSSPPLLKTYHLEHLPPTYAINVALFKDVKNAEFLREQLMAGNQDFEYAFINAATIVSTTHALAATFRAVKDFEDGRLRTRNVHSETVFSLNPSHNITDSFRRFGLSSTTTSLLVMKITYAPRFIATTPGPPSPQKLYTPLVPTSPPSTSPFTTLPTISAADIQSHLEKHVEGIQVEFTNEEVEKLTDVELVRKNYKLGVPIGSRGERKGGGGGGRAASLPFFDHVGSDRAELEVAAMGAMALKSFV